MTLSSSDLFIINRSGTDFSVSWDQIFTEVDANITIGDGTITIKDSDGNVVGSFTTNQDGDADIVLPQVVIPDSLHPKGFINVKDPAPAGPEHGDIYIQYNDGNGDVTADASFAPGITGVVEEGTFVIFGVDDNWHAGGQANQIQVQADWTETDQTSPAFIQNKPNIESIVDTQAGDGAININAGVGLIATGQNATANQKTETTRTLAAKVADGISINLDGAISIDPNFNLDANVTAPGNGQINVEPGVGLSATGTNATANQVGDTTRTLSVRTGAGLDFDLLGNLIIDPSFNLDGNVTAPGNGKLNFNDPKGTTLSTFSANQSTDEDVSVYVKDNYIQNLPSLQ